jgi:hypothetical protein
MPATMTKRGPCGRRWSINSAETTLSNESRDFRCGSILLQKSFWADQRKFLGPLMRFARGDVRDHIASSKIDHGASYKRYGVLQ